MKKKLLSALASLFLITSAHEAAAIPVQEQSALTDFYTAANGSSWANNSGWLGAAGTECNWYGIYCVGGHIVRLNLASNGLSGSITPSLGQLTRLRTLILSSNNLSGEIPSTLGQLSRLGLLRLEHNTLGGAIPASLGALSQLKHFSLDSNRLGGSIPSELGQLSQLLRFSVGDNQLVGSLPSELGFLSDLKYLRLDHNHFSGAIPATLGQLSQLTYLALDSNALTGSIPQELGNLTQLTSLAVSHNALSGEIPSSLGQLSHLKSFWLNANNLRGSIPAELGQLSQLTGLWMGSNLLTGTIPSSLTQLSQLRYFSSASNCVNTNDGALQNFLTSINAVYAHSCTEERQLLINSAARYNMEGQRVLMVEEVRVGHLTYSAKLLDLGNDQFALTELTELAERTHPSPASYHKGSLVLDIPVVYVPDLNTYSVQMKGDGKGKFSLSGATLLPPI
ncbi:MAG: hypothetical protein KAG19_00995 [Methylococcales bacterium]|nr:hypothetical protein [Methylococcales bacterium]